MYDEARANSPCGSQTVSYVMLADDLGCICITGHAISQHPASCFPPPTAHARDNLTEAPQAQKTGSGASVNIQARGMGELLLWDGRHVIVVAVGGSSPQLRLERHGSGRDVDAAGSDQKITMVLWYQKRRGSTPPPVPDHGSEFGGRWPRGQSMAAQREATLDSAKVHVMVWMRWGQWSEEIRWR